MSNFDGKKVNELVALEKQQIEEEKNRLNVC